MPLNKLQFNPGINKEVTKYTNEAGWSDCDKVRFRQGYPEKIGGWTRHGSNTFTGVCRSLHQWISLAFVKYTGLGTNVKFMVETGQNYFDVTPLRTTVTLGANPIKTTDESTSIEITHTDHGATLGSYVTLSGVPIGNVGGVPHTDINKEHVITEIVSTSKYKVVVATEATSTVSAGGGSSVVAAYQINVGPDFQIPVDGWSSSDWNDGTFNGGNGGAESLRLWSQANYGEDLIIGPRGGELYYWDTSAGTGTRAIPLKNVPNGAAVPISFQQTGCNFLDNSIGVAHPENANIVVGLPVSGSNIPAGATVAGIESPTIFRLSANTTGSGSGQTLSFGDDPITITENSNSLTVKDNSLNRVYEVGQHVTISGSDAIGNITTGIINTRHKIATVDTAAGTFTTEAFNTVATSTATGGGHGVSLQYELSAEVPVVQDSLLVSDASRFTFAFGCNAFGDTTETKNPLLLRWSAQEDVYDWRPRATNQAGDLQLSQGTEIVAAVQSRQEILVFTDSALYSLQYVGAPVVWGSQLVGSNLSVASSKAVAYANGVAYWMGKEKFYKYDGAVQPLRCDVRKHVFDDLDKGQYEQVFAGTLEEYHEVWWFYCDSQRVAPNKYVVYNYLEDIWYVGSMGRSAWYDSPINDFPLAATDTYNLVEHENGNDNGQGATLEAIDSFITSGQFGIESGTSFTFIDKVVPDLSFVGSTAGSPSVEMSLLASSEPGTADNNPASEGGVNEGQVALAVDTVDEYTDQLDVRVRGRQMAIKVRSNALGTKWQLGTPRLNMRPDGRRGR